VRYAVGGCLAAAALFLLGHTENAWWLVALAGVVGVLATRTWGRVPVGVALAVVGLAAMRVAGSRYVAAAGGVVLAATGVLVVRRGPGWGALGAKYDAPTGRPPTDADLWSALDRGDDPTE
jgi:hypothetical protein